MSGTSHAMVRRSGKNVGIGSASDSGSSSDLNTQPRSPETPLMSSTAEEGEGRDQSLMELDANPLPTDPSLEKQETSGDGRSYV